MYYTQVELTSPDKKNVEVLWLPVPAGKAKVGEKITRRMYDQACAPTEDPWYEEDWVISQVCVTLSEDHLPLNARKAEGFRHESSTLTYMSI